MHTITGPSGPSSCTSLYVTKPHHHLGSLPHLALRAPAYIPTCPLEVKPIRLLTDSQRVDRTGSYRNDGLSKCRPASNPSAYYFLPPPTS
ncbi:hypothetical protein BDZ89DRAFT_1064514, partial [Hymenopellis radicata]